MYARRALARILVVLALAPAASAQVNAAAAEKLFREAQDAMKAGQYAEACAKFADSNRLDPQLGTLLNLATCHEKEGKVATAWSEYTTLTDLAAKAGDTGRAEFSKKRAAALEPLPTLALKPGAGVTLKDVKIDEQSFGTAALSTAVPIDPGPHKLTISTDTKRWTQSITIGASGATTLDVNVPPNAESAEPAITAPPPVAVSSPLRPVGVALMGGGAGGLVLGGIFGALAIGDKSTVDNHCVGPLCDDQGLKAQDDAHTKALVSTIGFIAGGVLLAAGVTLFFVGKSKKTAARAIPSPSGLVLVF